MSDHKPWAVDDQEKSEVQPKPEVQQPKYEVVRKFSVGKGRRSKRVMPGDEVPKEVSEKAIASLLRKGVLKEL